MLVRKAERLLGQLVFAGQRRTKHCWIVSVECDHHSLIEVLTDGMCSERCTTAGAQITGKANLHGNLASGQFLNQFRILRGGQPVSEAFDAEIQRAPDRFRSGAFSGMGGKVQTAIGCICIGVTE